MTETTVQSGYSNRAYGSGVYGKGLTVVSSHQPSVFVDQYWNRTKVKSQPRMPKP